MGLGWWSVGFGKGIDSDCRGYWSKQAQVGDHYQLPPLVQSAAAAQGGLGESLFRRLCDAHPQARSSLSLQCMRHGLPVVVLLLQDPCVPARPLTDHPFHGVCLVISLYPPIIFGAILSGTPLLYCLLVVPQQFAEAGLSQACDVLVIALTRCVHACTHNGLRVYV